MDETSPRPKLGGSLFLGVSSHSFSGKILGERFAKFALSISSISPRTLPSTGSRTSFKNPYRLARSLCRHPDPSPSPPQEGSSAHPTRRLPISKPHSPVRIKITMSPRSGAFSSSSTPPPLTPSEASITSSSSSWKRAPQYTGWSCRARPSSETWSSISTGRTGKWRANGRARVRFLSFAERRALRSRQVPLMRWCMWGSGYLMGGRRKRLRRGRAILGLRRENEDVCSNYFTN